MKPWADREGSFEQRKEAEMNENPIFENKQDFGPWWHPWNIPLYGQGMLNGLLQAIAIGIIIWWMK